MINCLHRRHQVIVIECEECSLGDIGRVYNHIRVGVTIVVEFENNAAGDHVVLNVDLLDPYVPNIRIRRED